MPPTLTDTLRQYLPLFGYLSLAAFSAMLAYAALPREGRLFVRGPWSAAAMSIATLAAALGIWHASSIENAIVLLISSTVACLLFCPAVAMLAAPRTDNKPPVVRNVLGTQGFPLALCILLIGFASQFTIAAVVGMAILGVVTLDLGAATKAPRQEAPRPGSRLAFLAILFALLPAALVGFCTSQAAIFAADAFLSAPVDILIVNLLCPMLLIPILRHTTRQASRGDLASSMDQCTLIAAVNLGIFLPLLCVAWGLLHQTADQPLPLPHLNSVSWRLDGSMLLVSAMALMGLRFRMLRASRWLSFVLVILYAAYLMASTLLRIKL